MKRGNSGFTVLELLVAMAISSLIALVLVGLYQAGLWEYAHSSGRIELGRKGREALARITPLLTTAVKPNPVAEAIYAPPLPGAPYDTDPFNAPDLYTAVMFASPVDLLNEGLPPPDPRAMAYSLYEIALVPAADGNDIVLRKMIDPLTIDGAVTPRPLSRSIDNFDVKRVDNTALVLRVDISGVRLREAYVRNRTQTNTPLNISINTVVQIPYYTK